MKNILFVLFLFLIVMSCSTDVFSIKEEYFGEKIKTSHYHIDTVDKYYDISKIIKVDPPDGFFDDFNYPTPYYYNYNDSVFVMFISHGGYKYKQPYNDSVRKKSNYSSAQMIFGSRLLNKCEFLSKIDVNSWSFLFAEEKYVYAVFQFSGGVAISSGKNEEFCYGIIIFNRNNLGKYRVFKFKEEKVISAKQVNNYIRIVTVVVEPIINFYTRLSHVIVYHTPIGYYGATDIKKEYLFDENLNLVSEKEI